MVNELIYLIKCQIYLISFFFLLDRLKDQSKEKLLGRYLWKSLYDDLLLYNRFISKSFIRYYLLGIIYIYYLYMFIFFKAYKSFIVEENIKCNIILYIDVALWNLTYGLCFYKVNFNIDISNDRVKICCFIISL